MTTPARHRLDPRAAVRGYYAALDADDIEAVLEFFSGDVLYRRPGYARISGQAALRRYYSGERRLASGRHVVRSVVVDAQEAAAHGEWEGDVKDGGRASLGFAAFFAFDAQGRIREHTTYFFVPAL